MLCFSTLIFPPLLLLLGTFLQEFQLNSQEEHKLHMGGTCSFLPRQISVAFFRDCNSTWVKSVDSEDSLNADYKLMLKP